MPLPIIVVAGGGVLAAYLLGKSHRASPTNPAQPVNGNTGSNGVGTTQAVNNTPTTGSDLPIGLGQRDVSGDISNNEQHFLPVKQYLNDPNGVGANIWSGTGAIDGSGWDMVNNNSIANFFRWYWLPASKVKLSEITLYEWRLAFAMLGGSLHHRPDLEFRYRNFINGVKQDQESAFAGSIVAQVASIVPIIGKVFNQVVQAQVAAANSADMADVRGAGTMASGFRFSVDPKNLDPPAAMLLQPSYNGEGEKILDTTNTPWIPLAGTILQGPMIDGKVPSKYVGTPDFPWEPWAGGYSFNAHKRFFCYYQYGIFMPWICDEIFGKPAMSTKASVNLSARIYKAIDVLSVLAFPDVGVRNSERAVEGRTILPWSQSAPVYYYHNPVMGDVLGSVFPPTDEDVQIVNSDGYTLNWYGGLLPGYSFVGRDGIVHKLPSPHNAAEAASDEAQMAQWKATDDASIAKTLANAPMTNSVYWASIYGKAKSVGLDTQDVDGISWHSRSLSFEDILNFTPEMIKSISISQAQAIVYTGKLDVSRFSPDQLTAWKTFPFGVLHHAM